MADEENKDRTEPRHPRNLQGVLRLAVESGAAAGTSNAPSTALSSLSQEESEQRRRFLDSVLSSLSVDVASILRDSISILLTPATEFNDDEGAEEKARALDNVMDWVDNLDFSTVFHKIGGFAIFKPNLKSSNTIVRHKTAELIAELVQNHPYCQTAATEIKVLDDLLRLLDEDEDETVRIKSLYAISALLRDNNVAQEHFVAADGFSVVLRALQSDIDKLKIKSAFLLSAVCTERESFKTTLCDMGFVEQLVALILREPNPTQEHILAALLALVSDHPKAIKECQREELNLQEILTEKLKLLEGNDQYLEEYENCQKLLATCFSKAEGENNLQDR